MNSKLTLNAHNVLKCKVNYHLKTNNLADILLTASVDIITQHFICRRGKMLFSNATDQLRDMEE